MRRYKREEDLEVGRGGETKKDDPVLLEGHLFSWKKSQQKKNILKINNLF